MTRSYLFGALAALLLAGPAGAQDAPLFNVTPGFRVAPPPKAVEAPKVENPLWFALKVIAGNGHGSGTPVYCADGKTLVLTNAHVARQDRPNVAVVTRDGTTYTARRLCGSEVRNTGPSSIHVDGPDLAVLEVDGELGAVTIATELPPAGAAVYLWGYGGGQPAPQKSGRVTVNSFVEPTLTATLTSIPGDSGAGVFDAHGHLVGVNHGTGAGHGMHAVPLTEVRAFLKRPLLARLFPRLDERIEARQAARAAARTPPPVPEAKVDPFNPVAAAPAPKAGNPTAPQTGRMYRVGNGPWIDEAEFLRQFPGGLSGSNCPNGRCPNVRP